MLREKSSASSWIVAVVMCMALLGAFAIARNVLVGAPEGDGASVQEDDEPSEKRKKKTKKKKRRKRRQGSAQRGEEARGETYDDYDWEQDFVVDDSELGNVLAEREEEWVEVEAAPPPPPYEPKPNEWQPSGSYSPKARYGTIPSSGVTELDLSAPSGGSALDEVAVARTLNVRTVYSCYATWVDKIPQMSGRVSITVAVKPDGRVQGVEIRRSDLRSRVVEQCIVDKVARLRFPAASNGQASRFDTHFDFTSR